MSAFAHPLRIGIVGGGIAGLVAAWLLGRRHQVHLFDRDARLGGHARTETIDGFDADTGVLIFNDVGYPSFYRLLAALGLRDRMRDVEMSMTFYDRRRKFWFAGRKGLAGLLAQPTNALRPWFWRLVGEIARFKRQSWADFQSGAMGEVSLADYLASGGYSAAFAAHFLYPMAAAVWSVPGDETGSLSARAILGFLGHHAVLKSERGAKWQTVRGGTRSYVDALTAQLRGSIHGGVRAVSRDGEGATVIGDDGARHRFDRVIVATHADQALALLAAPSLEESRLLGAWRYSAGETLLHRDPSSLAPVRRAWSSWNITHEAGSARSITYWLDGMQGAPRERPVLLTLGDTRHVAPDAVVARIPHRHPLLTPEAVATQAGLAALGQGSPIRFCGSYFGSGFHEDAVASAFAAAATLGAELP